jgi:hypothetical protein
MDIPDSEWQLKFDLSTSETVLSSVIRRSQTAIGNCNWNLVLPVP